MDIFFLSNKDKPIVKTYVKQEDGSIQKESYPFVYEVTSEAHSPQSLEEMTQLMRSYAVKGNCLLKGKLARPLVTESRADTTNRDEPTEWICLDLDGINNFESIDLFLQTIGCGDTDYIIQWSSSMGIENAAGYRCHIMMQLDRPAHPKLLKHWLMDLNLSHLGPQLELTKTSNSLRWPLDITTCQNDKLLYIAAPKLVGDIADPFEGKERIEFCRRSKTKLTLPERIPSRESLRNLVDNKVAELREAANLTKKKSSKYKYSGNVEYMENPDTAVITESKLERGFVYLNLNGGDSWGYYHPEDNPQFIYNFKGEPTYRTEDLLPDYWASIKAEVASYKPNSKGVIYLAFRDFRTSNYYNGWYNDDTEDLHIAQAKSETQLRHFMKQHGQPLGDFIPDWTVCWDPHNPVTLSPETHTLNTYIPSDYMTTSDASQPVTVVPPTIMKVIHHALGSDVETTDHFLNWLCCIFQSKNRTGTAWVLQGTQGTGKGVMFHYILSPLFGDQNVVSKRMEELESEFTGFMENKFIVFIDEIEVGSSLYHSRITAKLKNLIVEPTISIRKMYTPPYMAPNFSNMIFASNKTAVEIPPDDRRFNVGGYQSEPIDLSTKEVEDMIPSELQAFRDYLLTRTPDYDKARKPLKNEARETLIDISLTSIDTVAKALAEGDLEFFWDHLSTTPLNEMSPLDNVRYAPYRELIINIINNPDGKLTRDELFTIFEWTVGKMNKSPNKFTAQLKHHKVHLSQLWKNGRNIRGLQVDWQYELDWIQGAKDEITKGMI